ncbi:MAG: ABC transporter permease [Acidimicrobiia bacterium]|nr:ABC transporter permease [Acidimicrobiia bacterium]
MTSETQTPDELPPISREHKEPTTVAEFFQAWWVRVQAGDLGFLPIIIGLVVIVIIFGSLDSRYLTERNFTNLLLQMASFATIGIGVVFVLLLAEIDLAIAFNSAVGGVVMTLLLRPEDPGWPWPLAIAVALTVTTAIGFVMGVIITKTGVPSFVVSLAFNLGLNGVVLILMTEFSGSGTIRIADETVRDISNAFLPDLWGWLLGIGGVAVVAGTELLKYRTRQQRGLPNKPMGILAMQLGGLAVVVIAAVWYANLDRGVPFVMVVLGFFLVMWSFIAGRTRFGRHVYAVGGNPEAARRAGISVDRVKISVFMIGGFMAGVGGIVIASRLQSVATNSGGGPLLLNVIAAAVIGGTSLFGGSGKVVSALLGALVIAAVENGMGLQNVNSGVKFVVTGLVLLAAVLADAFAKRRQTASGIR